MDREMNTIAQIIFSLTALMIDALRPRPNLRVRDVIPKDLQSNAYPGV